MTENQEKELFNILGTLVTGVREIKVTLDEHSQTLNLLVSKVDSVADTVMTNDKRLRAVEKDVDELRGQVH